MYYLTNFILFSILGYIFETLTALLFHINSESGFMYGPYTIVYGLGITLMFLLLKKYNHIKEKYKKYIFMFISGFITLIIIEFIGGTLLKEIYNVTMWNYTKLPLHIGKYISIEVTTIWTLGIILIYEYIKPFTDKIIKKIPKTLTIGISLIMVFDLIITTIISFY